MKNQIKLILAGLLLAASVNAQSVNFAAVDWAQLQEQSKTSNKYIFIDCMTDWCSWCKVMDKETFHNADVANFMNANFISSQIDMEKGFGVHLAAKYRVTAFPTFLVFNSSGRLVYRSVGYQKPEAFMASVKTSIDPLAQMSFPGISEKMDPGFPDFYKNAFGTKDQRKKVEPGTAENFLDNQKDLTNEVSWSVMSRFKLNDKYNQYFLENITTYRRLYGDEIENKAYSIISSKLNQAIKDKDNDLFKECFAMVDQFLVKDKESIKQDFMFRYYSGIEAWDKFAAEFQNYVTKTNYSDAATINEYCWSIYEDCNDAAVIAKACDWMKMATKNEPNYMYLDTYAALLYKNKNYSEANRMASLAIETGKKENQDVHETEELQLKIKEAMKGK